MTYVELLAAILFIGSSGLFFNDKFRKNRLLVGCAGLIALVSTYFLTIEVVDRVVDARLATEVDIPNRPVDSPSGSAATAPANSSVHPAEPNAVDEAAIFKAAGFERQGNKYRRCPDDTRGGAEIDLLDLNGDGASEARVSESSPYCYGLTDNVEVFLRLVNGVWRPVLDMRGTARILQTKHSGWRDIEIGGPGFGQVPVFQFNGDQYVRSGSRAVVPQ